MPRQLSGDQTAASFSDCHEASIAGVAVIEIREVEANDRLARALLGQRILIR